jgi:hypothetical protein
VYQLTLSSSILRLADNALIPNDLTNRDWQVYQEWLLEGNIPQPVSESVLASSVRGQRDALLSMSDNRALADRWAAMTTQQQQAWATYRQQLRDVPEQPGFPENVTWPVAPS